MITLLTLTGGAAAAVALGAACVLARLLGTDGHASLCPCDDHEARRENVALSLTPA